MFGCPDHLTIKYVPSRNTRGYEAQFILRMFLELRCVPELLMNGTKVLSMRVENLNVLYSLHFWQMSLKSITKSLDLTSKKGNYPNYLTPPKIWIVCAFLATPISMGET